MFIKIIVMIFSSIWLNAYELPTLNLPEKNVPEIIKFEVEGVVENEQQLYRLSWETLNATDVKISEIGKVQPKGSIVISQEEYDMGPINLIASNSISKKEDKMTLKKIIIDKNRPRKSMNKKGPPGGSGGRAPGGGGPGRTNSGGPGGGSSDAKPNYNSSQANKNESYSIDSYISEDTNSSTSTSED